ncbi:MAG TPA: phosphotransferase family protein [Solirubrobacteraceae bacterium]|nr:phosphotransferase family protein [Solirubrobacteraceae bacterium]
MDHATHDTGLEQAAEAVFGGGTTVEVLGLLSGGASRQLLRADAIGSDGQRHALVISERPGHLPAFGRSSGEFRGMSVARLARIPAPLPYTEIPSANGSDPRVMMSFVEGEARARRILTDPRYEAVRRSLAGEVATAAARLHSVTLSEAGLEDVDRDVAAIALDELEQMLDRVGEPHPALEAGLRLLRRSKPATSRANVLVHGDLRLGNMLVDEHGLTALIDWELCHVGDAAEDLGWMCARSWRFGADERPALGLDTRERLLAAYEAAGGAPVAPRELRWWEAYANARWAAVCIVQADRHLSGAEHSLELAAIGRRSCEAEWDLLAAVR